MKPRLASFIGVVLILSCLSVSAVARTLPILAEPLAGKKVRIDGVPGEWPSEFSKLSVALRGSSSKDPRASGNVGYDGKYLYVAMKVYDKTIYRTKAASRNEDHATLILAVPGRAGGYSTHWLRLYPGKPGKVAGVVKLAGHSVKGASLVEAPMEGGFTFEARIPWSQLPGTQKMRVGLRAALRYDDADGGSGVRHIVGTSGATKGGSLPPLLLEAEQGLYAALVEPKGLPSAPARSAYGNLVGGPMLEQVALHGIYLSILGPDFRGGKEFHFSELGIESAKNVRALKLVDFDGDGHDEIMIRLRIGTAEKYREILNVMKLGADDTPKIALSQEVSIHTDEGDIVNKFSLRKAGRGRSLVIRQGKASGFDPRSYGEPEPGGGTRSALMPWDTVKSRVLTLSGDTFKAVSETHWEPKLAPPGSGTASRRKREKASGPAGAAIAPPAPRPPTAEELLDKVYALYRRERGVRSKKPRFDFVTDVAGDTTPERVLIHGKDIVVFGKRFRSGKSYAYITIGASDPENIKDVTARDLTGDGKAEILVRAVLPVKTSEALGGDIVNRYAFIVYQAQGERLRRIFGAETGRALGKNRILAAVAFERGARGLDIELRPGRAIGWTEETYPFPEDTSPAGGLEPLLLPWGTQQRRYRYDGSLYTED